MTRELSTGGMGVVCEAVHEATGRRVALKIIRDSAAFGKERAAWLERFKREARAAGSIDTPHITQVFDAATDTATGEPFIAMELLSGADLSQTLKELGPLPPELALRIVAQACRGLEKAHAAGVVHRDIKPGNLFLSEVDGRVTVKLVDFGIAKVVADESTGPEAAELTRTGSVLGTPTYMAPEQAQGLKTVDHRADIWSLGVVLYKALSDTVPHRKTEGLGQLIVAICTEPAPPIRSKAAWVPPEVAVIVARCLQIDPARRYQSASELSSAIEALVPDVGIRKDELRGLSAEERSHAAVDQPQVSEAISAERLVGHEESRTQPGLVRPVTKSPRRSVGIVLALAGAAGVVALALALSQKAQSSPAREPERQPEPAPVATTTGAADIAPVAPAPSPSVAPSASVAPAAARTKSPPSARERPPSAKPAASAAAVKKPEPGVGVVSDFE